MRNVECAMCSVLYSVSIMLYAVCSGKCAKSSVQFAMCSVQSVVCNVQSAMCNCSVHCGVFYLQCFVSVNQTVSIWLEINSFIYISLR